MISSNDFHPMRYQRNRPFAHNAFQAWDRLVGRKCHPTLDAVNAIQGLIVGAFNTKSPAQRASAVRSIGGDLTGLVTREASFACHVARYRAYGRNIFRVAPSLVDLLKRTDLQGVRFSDLKFPYQSFYIAFGNGFDGILPGHPNFIDGAYITASDDSLQIVITSRRTDIKANSSSWPFDCDRYFFLGLDFSDDQGQTLQEALDRSVADGSIPLEPRPLDDVSYDALAEAVGIEASRLVDRRPQTAQIDSAFARGGYSVASRALALIANTLCWLAMRGREESEERLIWPDDAPSELVDMLSSPRPALRQNSRSELTKRGFSQIALCDLAVSQPPRNSSTHPSGIGVAPHWRRGHWRRQPCGSDRTEIRLQWIKPTFVGDAARVGEAGGHIYHMNASS